MVLSKWLDSELREKHEFLTYALLGWIAVVHIYGITDFYGWRLDYLLGVTIIGLVTGGFAWIVGLPLLELTGGDGLYYTLWAHGPMAAFFFVLWLGSKFQSDKSTSSLSAPIIGDAFDPKVSDSVLPKRANRDVWDEYYDKLVALNGCGLGTAQRIISKVQADQELTNHERNFWQQVQ